jgi:hypothetical protein
MTLDLTTALATPMVDNLSLFRDVRLTLHFHNGPGSTNNEIFVANKEHDIHPYNLHSNYLYCSVHKMSS